MRSLILFFVLFITSFHSMSQEAVNKTDDKGLKQGKWVTRYPGGSLRYEGTFGHSKPVGEWKRYHENGKIKALMNYRPNSARVFATLFDEDGVCYAKGVFEGTLRDSIWHFYSGDILLQTENYRLGKKEGKSTVYHPDGKMISEKEWKNDLPDGIAIEYDPSGIKRSEISYIEGKKSGRANFYDESGALTMEGSYLDDLSDGTWKMFEKDGKLKYQIIYQKGEILNSGALDSMQINQFKQYDKVRGKIPEPKMNETELP